MNNSSTDSIYNEPKWLAAIADDTTCFWFKDGTRVASMWDLRTALVNVKDEDLLNMVGDNFNHIATWIAETVGDTTLAAEMQNRLTRWELIGALERHMIRCVAVPGFLAKRWLTYSKASFVALELQTINNLRELAVELKKHDNNVVRQHIELRPNDIIEWIDKGVGDTTLADSMRKNGVNIDGILDHIQNLEETAASTCNCNSGCDCCGY